MCVYKVWDFRGSFAVATGDEENAGKQSLGLQHLISQCIPQFLGLPEWGRRVLALQNVLRNWSQINVVRGRG